MKLKKCVKKMAMTLSIALTTALMVLGQTPSRDNIQYVHFLRGKSQSVLYGKLKAHGSQIYKLQARAGQTLTADIKSASNKPGRGSEVVFWVQTEKYQPGRDSLVLDGIDKGGVTHWSGTLPESGEYTIYVSSPPVSDHAGTGRIVNYTLTIAIK